MRKERKEYQRRFKILCAEIVRLEIAWYNYKHRAPADLVCKVTGSQREERTRTQAVAGTSYFQRTARQLNLYYIVGGYNGR